MSADYWCKKCIDDALAQKEDCSFVMALSELAVMCPHLEGDYASCDQCGEFTQAAKDEMANEAAIAMRDVGGLQWSVWKDNQIQQKSDESETPVDAGKRYVREGKD